MVMGGDGRGTTAMAAVALAMVAALRPGVLTVAQRLLWRPEWPPPLLWPWAI